MHIYTYIHICIYAYSMARHRTTPRISEVTLSHPYFEFERKLSSSET